MRTLRRLLLAAALTAAAVPANLFAAEGGYSNYLPGTYGDFAMAVEPADRWTLRNDLYFYDADTDRSVRSGRLELGTELDFLMNLTTLLYKPGAELFGARYAAGIFVPLVDLELETSVSVGDSTLRVDDSASGLGDVALIPIALFWNRDKIHTSFVQLVVTPTGSYDVDNSIQSRPQLLELRHQLRPDVSRPGEGPRPFVQRRAHLQHRERRHRLSDRPGAAPRRRPQPVFSESFAARDPRILAAADHRRQRRRSAAGRLRSRSRRCGTGALLGKRSSADGVSPSSPSGCTSSTPTTGSRATTSSLRLRCRLVTGAILNR